MDYRMQQLFTAVDALNGSPNGSYLDVIGQLPVGISMIPTISKRGALSDVTVRLLTRNVGLSIKFTTDMRTFNVYPNALVVDGEEYRYSYCNGVVIFDKETTPTVAALTAKIIAKLIEVF